MKDPIFWLDADGKHVWVRHTCTNGVSTEMLPYGKISGWWHDDDSGDVKPSVQCEDCGMHVMGKIGPAPIDWVLSQVQVQP